ENALKGYPGTVMCVSHDRYFLDRVARRLLILQPPGIIDFPDTYSAWVRKQKERAEVAQEKSERSSASAPKAKPKPAPPRETKENTRKDNPYARPFGRLTLKELRSEERRVGK